MAVMLEEDMPGVGTVAEAVNTLLSEVGYAYHQLSPKCRKQLESLERKTPRVEEIARLQAALAASEAQVAGLVEALACYSDDVDCSMCDRPASSGARARAALTAAPAAPMPIKTFGDEAFGASIREAGYRAGLEAAAALIRDNTISYGETSTLRPRPDGDQSGLEWAAAILALPPEGGE